MTPTLAAVYVGCVKFVRPGPAAERLSVGRGEGGELNRERREGVAPAI